jgi:hypothetical protein
MPAGSRCPISRFVSAAANAGFGGLPGLMAYVGSGRDGRGRPVAGVLGWAELPRVAGPGSVQHRDIEADQPRAAGNPLGI